MAQTNLRGSTAVAAAPASPQARSVRTAAETAERPQLPQSYYEAQNRRAGEFGLPANSGDWQGTWLPGSAPTEQNAWDFLQFASRYPSRVPKPDTTDGQLFVALKQYFADVEKYNSLVASGPATKPRAATAPTEERSASFQAKRRGSPETILTAGWGLDDKPRAKAKVLLGE